MIKEKEQKQSKYIEIDLTGPEGNAFYLLGTAKKLSYQLDLDWEIVQAQMTDNDYEWLVQTFEHYFGDFVVMYR